MFWGLILEAGKKYTQTVEQSFHISMAAIEPSTGSNDIVSLIVNYEDEEYFLCSLSKNVLQQTLDLNFMEGSSVSFHTVGGKAKIHLTGYVLPEENEDDFGDFEEGDEEMGEGESGDEMEDEEGEEEIEEEEEELQAPVQQGKRKLEEKKKAKVEQPEEPVAVESPSKKAKKEKKKQQKAAAEAQKQQESQGKPAVKAEKANVNGSPAAAQKPAAATPSPKKRKLAGGLVVEDVKEGTGHEAKKGSHVSVYYSGRLQSNNKQFDKTVKGPGFKFRLGAGEVIKGWDLGVEGMKIGGKRKLTIPAHLAYGPRGSPPAIPPNSTLVFDVELKAIN